MFLILRLDSVQNEEDVWNSISFKHCLASSEGGGQPKKPAGLVAQTLGALSLKDGLKMRGRILVSERGVVVNAVLPNRASGLRCCRLVRDSQELSGQRQFAVT